MKKLRKLKEAVDLAVCVVFIGILMVATSPMFLVMWWIESLERKGH